MSGQRSSWPERLLIAVLALGWMALLTCPLAEIVSRPFLGRGIYQVRAAGIFQLLPIVSYLLVALAAFAGRRRGFLQAATAGSFLLLLPIVVTTFAIDPIFGLLATALLIFPLAALWLWLYRAYGRTPSAKSD